MMQDCLCDLPQEMIDAGLAATLCHHSTTENITDTQNKLFVLLANFSHQIPAEHMFMHPLHEVAQTYMQEILGMDYNLINAYEHNVLMISFLRHISIGAQTLMTTMMLGINEQNQTATT